MRRLVAGERGRERGRREGISERAMLWERS